VLVEGDEDKVEEMEEREGEHLFDITPAVVLLREMVTT